VNAALVFVCSDQVGPYINALSYLADKLDVRDFLFVFTTGAMMEGPRTAFVDTIIDALGELAQGRYLGRAVSVDSAARAAYSKLSATLTAKTDLVRSISLEELGGFLGQQAGRTSRGRLFVDVTGLPKILMAHVMLICVSAGYSAYAFELRHAVNRSHPEKSLYHALPFGAFEYPSLTRDPAVQSSVRKLIPIRRIVWATVLLSSVGVTCFAALLLVSPSNQVLAVIGLAANIIGIAGGGLQALAMRRGEG
jgi:hypothetical protein